MLPSLVSEPPKGGAWIHEIKHDGYRTLLAVDGERTRAFTRRGNDWSTPIKDDAKRVSSTSTHHKNRRMSQEQR
jgi:ATP-dependent DNA ligase